MNVINRPYFGHGRCPRSRHHHLGRTSLIATVAILAFAGLASTTVHATQNFSNQDVNTPVVFDSSANSADTTTFDMSVDMFTNTSSYVKLVNTDTFNAAVTMGTSDGIHLQDGNSQMIIGTTGSVVGYGRIVQDNGGATVTNDGTIDANNASGSLLIAITNLDNDNLMEATNNGSLLLESTTINNYGAITADGGTVTLQGGTYNGETGSSLNQTVGSLIDNGTALAGDITVTGTTGLTFSTSGGNSITNGTITGNLDLATGGNGYVKLIGANTFNQGTIDLDESSSGNGIHLQDGNASLTIGNTGTLEGTGYVIQDNGGGTLTNNGTINANVNGGTLALGLTNFNNTSLSTTALSEATDGGTLEIASTNVSNSGAFTATANSLLEMTGGTYTGASTATLNQVGTGELLVSGETLTGTIAVTGTTGLTFDTSGANVINNGTVTGNLNLADATHDAYVKLVGNNTYDSGTISLAENGGTDGIHLQDGNATLTLESNAILNGYGYVRQDNGGSQVTNDGLIDSNSSGNPLYLQVTNLLNNATMEATSGGSLYLQSTNVTNNDAITANGGNVYLQSTYYTGDTGSSLNQTSGLLEEDGTRMSDLIDVTGSTGLSFTTNGGNIIDTGTVTGNLNLADATQDSYVKFVGNNTYDSGTISLAENGGTDGIHLQDGNATLTLGSDATLNGYGYVREDNGGSHVTNNGVIDSNSSGNPLYLQVTNLLNNATMEATNGGNLDLQSTYVTNNDAITANGGNVYLQSTYYTGDTGSSLNQTSGLLEEDGTRMTGLIDITGATGLSFTTNGNNVIDTGTVTGNLNLAEAGQDSYVKFVNNNTYDSGTISLAENGSTDGIHLQDGNATLTLGSNAILNGYGYVREDNGGSHVTNNGLIDSNSGGNSVYLQVTNLLNNATMEATNGGSLYLQSTYVTNNDAITANGGNVYLQSTYYTGDTGSSLNQTSGLLEEDGTRMTGLIDITGATGLSFTTNGGNIIDTGTVTGNLNLAEAGQDSYVKFVNNNTYDSGTISLAENGSSDGIHLQDGNATLTLGSNAILNGYGYVREDNGGSHVTNDGLIDSNSSGNPLYLQVTNLLNNATMEATNGGNLDLQSTYVTNNDAITANGGNVYLQSTYYTGDTGSSLNQTSGLLEEDGTRMTGLIDITGSTGLSFTTNGNNVIDTGTVTGNLNLAEAGQDSYVKFVNNNTYDHGTITLGETANGNGIHLQDGNATLTLGSNAIVKGYGFISEDNGGSHVNNAGVVNANSSGKTLTVAVSNFSNTGISEATSGGILNLASTNVTNSGTIYSQVGSTVDTNSYLQNSPAVSSGVSAGSGAPVTPTLTQVDGTMTISGGTGTATIDAGTLEGTGTINGDVDNVGGTVKGGDSPGTLTINGSLTQGAGSTFLEQLGGTPASGLFDVVDVSGVANLDGTLEVSLLNGFDPTLGQEFTFLNATGGVDNTFSSISGPSGYTFGVIYNANDAILTVDRVSTSPAPESSSMVSFGLLLAAGLGFVTVRSARSRRSAV